MLHDIIRGELDAFLTEMAYHFRRRTFPPPIGTVNPFALADGYTPGVGSAGGVHAETLARAATRTVDAGDVGDGYVFVFIDDAGKLLSVVQVLVL